MFYILYKVKSREPA